jgi:DNA polymerase-3 subunit beta
MESAARKIDKKAATQGFSITIEKSNLLKAISRLQSLVEKRNTIPILSNVKLEANEKSLTLTVTDMDLVASEEVDANIAATGALTVPALTLYDIIRKLPEGSQVSLKADAASSRLNVNAGTANFTLSYLPAEDFPVMSEGELTHKFNLASKDFLKLIDKTKFAMSNEETRYYLNGVYFHISNGNLRAVATDGHRLASVELAAPEGSAGMPGIIIPRKAVNEIGKLLESQNEVTISLSETKIKINAGRIELLSKVVDGTFPDYSRVIPENNGKIVTVSSVLFNEAVDRVSTIAADKTRAVKVKFEKGNITLNSQGIEGTSAKEVIACEYSSDALEVGFNSRYVLEMMSQIKSDKLSIALDNPNSPALIKDPTDQSVTFIIMPMRV